MLCRPSVACLYISGNKKKPWFCRTELAVAYPMLFKAHKFWAVEHEFNDHSYSHSDMAAKWVSIVRYDRVKLALQ